MEKNTKNKVLIVEDEPVLLKTLSEKFSMEGFHVLEAKNGEEGLEMALKEHPDLIMSDIVMPKMDGMTMLQKLREDLWGVDAKVILLTNLSDNEQVASALQNGVFNYLVKSNWKIEDIVTKAKEMLR